MKKINLHISLLLSCFMLAGLTVSGQQDPQISQYTMNKMMYNPGFTGIDDVTSVTMMVRNQWGGMDGSPTTRTLSIDAPIPTGGVGLSFISDQIGVVTYNKFFVNYAFRLLYADKSSFAVGLSGGLNQFTVDGSKYRSPGGVYDNEAIEHNDDLLPSSLAGASNFDLNAGVYYSRPRVFAGISMTHLLQPTNEIGAEVVTYKRNMYLTGGIDHFVNEMISFRPSVLVKTEFKKMQMDLNFNVVYDNNIWFGTSLRGMTKNNHDAIVLIAGMNVTNQFVVGYSYDIHTSSIGKYSSGTHEFVMNYKILGWGLYQNAKLIYCPRFL